MAFSGSGSRFDLLSNDAADPSDKKNERSTVQKSSAEMKKAEVCPNKAKQTRKEANSRNSMQNVPVLHHQMQGLKIKRSTITDHLLNSTAAGNTEKDSPGKEFGNYEEFPPIDSSAVSSNKYEAEAGTSNFEKKSKNRYADYADELKEDKWEEWDEKPNQGFAAGGSVESSSLEKQESIAKLSKKKSDL